MVKNSIEGEKISYFPLRVRIIIYGKSSANYLTQPLSQVKYIVKDID